ncbi:hypothetical protein ACFWXK_40120 [Streptomyces sp. NPDC059070]|uniref:hypothetical protein n=1 Tax=unclassified Streptomyces TaxID=2593676 RepID=UPI0034E249F6
MSEQGLLPGWQSGLAALDCALSQRALLAGGSGVADLRPDAATAPGQWPAV